MTPSDCSRLPVTMGPRRSWREYAFVNSVESPGLFQDLCLRLKKTACDNPRSHRRTDSDSGGDVVSRRVRDPIFELRDRGISLAAGRRSLRSTPTLNAQSPTLKAQRSRPNAQGPTPNAQRSTLNAQRPTPTPTPTPSAQIQLLKCPSSKDVPVRIPTSHSQTSPNPGEAGCESQGGRVDRVSTPWASGIGLGS
jgi:hypothetical protein